MCFLARTWADREGPQICNLYVFMFAGAEARPKAPGARRGPQGAENQPKNKGRIYYFILPEVCPRTSGVLKNRPEAVAPNAHM